MLFFVFPKNLTSMEIRGIFATNHLQNLLTIFGHEVD